MNFRRILVFLISTFFIGCQPDLHQNEKPRVVLDHQILKIDNEFFLDKSTKDLYTVYFQLHLFDEISSDAYYLDTNLFSGNIRKLISSEACSNANCRFFRYYTYPNMWISCILFRNSDSTDMGGRKRISKLAMESKDEFSFNGDGRILDEGISIGNNGHKVYYIGSNVRNGRKYCRTIILEGVESYVFMAEIISIDIPTKDHLEYSKRLISSIYSEKRINGRY